MSAVAGQPGVIVSETAGGGPPPVVTTDTVLNLSTVPGLALTAALDALDIPIQNRVYVAPNGNDLTGNGSILRPFASVTAAMANITTAAPTKRFSIMVTGRITEVGAIVMKANVFVVGTSPQNTRCSATSWTIGADWTPAGDHRAGFLNITVNGAITIDWNAVSANEGKFYFEKAWVNSAVTFTRFSDINQIFCTQSLTFSAWTFNGCAILSQTTLYQGNVSFVDGPAAGRFSVESTNDLFLGTLSLTRTASASDGSLLNSYCSALTIAGALTVTATPAGIPAAPALSGGAVLTPVVNGTLRKSAEVAAAGANTTASAVYATLLTLSFTMGGIGVALFDFSAGFANNNAVLAGVFFRLQINGTTWRSVGGSSLLGNIDSAALTGRVPVGTSGLVVGANTITIQWRCAAGTTTIDPANDGQHAALLAREVIV